VATEVFNLQGSIGLDTSAFTQNISKAMNSADNMSKHLDHVGDSIEDAQKAIDKAVDVVNGFGKSVTNLESPFTTLNNKLEVCQSATQAAQEQVDYLTENFNEYAKSAGTASEDTAALYEALQKAEHQLAQCQAAEQAAQEARLYVVNKRSGVFHYPSCDGAKSIYKKNRMEVTATRKELTDQGYIPCGYCEP
jgi:archaellum component FlaC